MEPTKLRPKRPSADNTRQSILTAARKCFLKNGFYGTSMQQIADLAAVNQNLLFHHFTNKKTLWQRVKAEVVQANQLQFKPDVSNLKNFIASIVRHWFVLYDENPDFVRLMKWQQLEATETTVIEDFIATDVWYDSINYLQKRYLINPNLEPRIIILFISASIYGPFVQANLHLTTLQKELYQELVIRSCIEGLRAK